MSDQSQRARPTPPEFMADLTAVFGAFEDSIALVGVYDLNERLMFCNAAFREAYFIDVDEKTDWQAFTRRNFAAGRGTRIDTPDIDAWIASVRSRRGKDKQRTYESALHDGRYIWVTETMMDNGWIIYVGTDVSTLHVSQRQLRLDRDAAMRDSRTDSLTGVSNRRDILIQMEEMMPEVQGDAFDGGCVALIDIDFFKQFNDTYGHSEGDAVLIALAHTCRDTADLRDSFGRLGGEEFLMLLPGKDITMARITMLKVQEAVRALRPITSAPDAGVTFSAGLAEVTATSTVMQVLGDCDKALYAAKNAGRDQLWVFGLDT